MRKHTFLAWALLFTGIWYFTCAEQEVARLYAYPLRHQVTVFKAAKEYSVPTSLVTGVIWTESKFKENATSDRGALGLMQLMPETAHWIAEQLNQNRLTDEDIKQPAVNIQMGTWYLGYLLKEFKGNQILALAAYNAGRGHVEEWMQTYGWDYTFRDISKIPFPETRSYVILVQKNAKRYEELYPILANMP